MVSLRKRRSKGEDLTIPSVILQLTSGREIVGFVFDMIVGNQGTSVVVQTDVKGGQPRVVYTDLDKVEAISFLDLKSIKKPKPAPAPKFEKPKAAVVQFEAPAPAPKLEKPKAEVVQFEAPASIPAPVTVVGTSQTRVSMTSELDIQKLLMKFSSMWTMVFDTTVNVDIGWSTFSKSPRTLGNLKILIQNFRAAIEEMGNGSRKEALRSQLQSVRFVHGVSFDVTIDSQTITVQGPLVGSSGEVPSKIAIFNKIEVKLF